MNETTFPADTLEELLPLIYDLVLAAEEIYSNCLDLADDHPYSVTYQRLAGHAKQVVADAYWLERECEVGIAGGE